MIPLLLADVTEAMLLDELFLSDDSYSSAVQSAHFNPLSGTVEVTFTRGGTYRFPCSIHQWLAYKSADSKGDAVNDLMGR